MQLFEFLQVHRLVYWGIYAALAFGLLQSVAAQTGEEADGSHEKAARTDLLFAVLTGLLLFWGRFPTWVFPEQNPDESQALATAITLVHDPRFWLSVDAGTHGPMVSVPLLIARLFGAPLGFATARCVGAAMLGGAFVCSFDVCRRRFGALPARLAVLPMVFAFSVTLEPDFVAYNGEMPVVFLLALGICLADRALSCDATRRRLLLLLGAGVSLGLIPWVKLQGGPSAAIAAAVVLVILYVTCRQIRELGAFTVALAVPTIAFLAYIVSIHAFRDFYRGYLVFATQYGDTYGDWEFRFWATLGFVFGVSGLDPFLGPIGSAIIVLVIGFISVELRRAVRRVDVGVVALILAATLFELYKAGKGFGHYLVLLTVPLVLVIAVLLQGWLAALRTRGARPLVVAAYCASFFWPLETRLAGASPMAIAANARDLPKPQAPLTTQAEEVIARRILYYAHPGDRLLVWGWMASLHVYTQLPQAVRYGDQWQIPPPPDDDAYFAEKFVSDFDAAPVPLVVDSVGPLSCCLRDRATGGYETFRPLAERIRRDYELVWDRDGLRLFVRKDRLSSIKNI